MATEPTHHTEDDVIHEAMDWDQHRATYEGFMQLVKWGIVSMVFVVLALYAFIEGHNALVGVVLLVLSVAVPIAGAFLGGRRRVD